MRDLIDILTAFETLSAENVPMALATIVAVERSSYRRPGARMLVAVDGRRFGTVSGGCLEADVSRRAQGVIANNTPALCRYETGDDPEAILYLDDDASGREPGVSLGCGGALEIFIEPVSADRPGALRCVADAVHRNRSSQILLVYRVGGNVNAELGAVIPICSADETHALPLPVPGERARERVFEQNKADPNRHAEHADSVGVALARLLAESPQWFAETKLTNAAAPPTPIGDHPSNVRSDDPTEQPTSMSSRRPSPAPSPWVQAEGGTRSYFRRLFVTGGWFDVLVETITPPPHLMILGDGPDALPLIELAKFQGWRTTVAGYRAATKLPADTTIHLTDHHEANLEIDPVAAVVVMTHDLLRDARLLRRLADVPPRYVGVLGPMHRTHRLLAAASTDAAAFAGRLFAPIGLDLGGEGPQRVALSIIAEIAAVLAKHAGGHLRDKAGGIHETTSAASDEPARTISPV